MAAIDRPIHLKMNKELNDFKNVNATSFLVSRTGMLDLWFLHDFGVKTLFYAFYCHRPLLHRKIQDDRHFVPNISLDFHKKNEHKTYIAYSCATKKLKRCDFGGHFLFC